MAFEKEGTLLGSAEKSQQNARQPLPEGDIQESAVTATERYRKAPQEEEKPKFQVATQRG